MLARTSFSIATLAGFSLAALALITACSGGGGSAPAPGPAPTLGGLGPTFTFDQHVNFTVIVPPATTTNAVASARRRRLGDSTVSNPYVSPNTQSITLQIGTVNGQSPRVLPPLQTFNITCPSAGGCSVPIQNVAAAKGVDRFAVQTFAGPGGTGNVISTGAIDVTVPSTQATSFGGTALSIGGFVKSLSLTATIPGGAFQWRSPANGTVDVNAIDPGGAIIIGSDQLAYPITVSIPAADEGVFLLNGVAQLTLQQPAQSLTLAYNGTPLFDGTVAASTFDENDAPVTATVAIAVTPPPTPTPKPVPSAKAPLSLYVYDGSIDRVFEFAGVNDVESGKPFGAQPRRMFDLAQPPSLDPNAVTCLGQPFITNMAFTADGTMYVQTHCNDIASLNNYVLSYGPSAVDIVAAHATPSPPLPASVLSVGTSNAGGPAGIKIDAVHNQMYVDYQDPNGGLQFVSAPIANPSSQSANFGAVCLQDLGFALASQACSTDPTYGYVAAQDFAVDGTGYVYVPTAYEQTDYNTVPNVTLMPPGPAPQIPGEPTIAVFPPNLKNDAPSAVSGLAGFADDLGGNPFTNNSYVSIEGSNIYVLANSGQIATSSDPSAPQVYAGLSGCGTTANAAQSVCAPDSSGNPTTANYIVGFANGVELLTSAANAGTNVVPAGGPTFLLGGDAIGQFGGPPQYGIGSEVFAVRDGFAFVLKASTTGGNTELDVYNLNGLTGVHTDIAPVTRFVFDSTLVPVPVSIAIGPTGSAVTPASLLRMPARVHHDIKAWAARRKALLEQRRRRLHL